MYLDSKKCGLRVSRPGPSTGSDLERPLPALRLLYTPPHLQALVSKPGSPPHALGSMCGGCNELNMKSWIVKNLKQSI